MSQAIARTLVAAVSDYFRIDDDCELSILGELRGKPEDGGFIFVHAELDDSRVRFTFRGGVELTVTEPEEFCVTENRIRVTTARELCVRAETTLARVVENGDYTVTDGGGSPRVVVRDDAAYPLLELHRLRSVAPRLYDEQA